MCILLANLMREGYRDMIDALCETVDACYISPFDALLSIRASRLMRKRGNLKIYSLNISYIHDYC